MWIETLADNASQQAENLAQAVANKLTQAIDDRGRACLAVSGGKSPKVFFQQLSKQTIDWGKVLITLVDERWLAPDDDDSNEKLVRDHLLINLAQAAYFLPLKNNEPSPGEGIMACETQLREQIDQLDVVVLGMGLDGHTASWFAGSQQLAALTSEHTSAWCLAVDDDFLAPPRMSLTWSFLQKSGQIFLSLQGEEKHQILNKANTLSDRNQLPIAHVLQSNDVDVQVFYNP